MISLLLIGFGALCNSVMDVCSFHYDRSVFRGLNPGFWDGDVSWKSKYEDWDGGDRRRRRFMGLVIHPAFTDSWHLFKSIMVVSICLGVVMYESMYGIWDLFIFGGVWNLVFSIGYKILKR